MLAKFVRTRMVIVALCLLPLLIAGACGGDDSESASSSDGGSSNSDVTETTDGGVTETTDGGVTETTDGGVTETTNGDVTETTAPALDDAATLVFATTSQPTVWDPIQFGNANAAPYYLRMPYDQLVQLDTNLEPTAMLATSWEVADDGLSTTFTLRDDVTFWDGSPLDAAAVKANLERAKSDPKSLVAAQLKTVSAVTAPDPTTVVVEFSQPNHNFPLLVASDIRIGSIVNPAALTDPNLATKPQGSGPYTMTEATSAGVIYDRVPNHWDETSGRVARIQQVSIADPNARINALRSGQVMATVLFTAEVSDLSFISDSSPFRLQRFEDSASINALQLNITKPNISNPLVRQAISLAIDRSAINTLAAGGEARDTQQMFLKGGVGFVPELDEPDALEPNIERAKELLAEAGVPDGFSLSVVTASTLTFQVTGIQLLEQQLAQIGIKLDISLETTTAALTSYQSGSVDAYYNTMSSTVDPTQFLAANITAGRGFGNPDYLDADIKAAASLAPGPERNAAYEDIQRTLAEKPVHVVVGELNLLIATTKQVVGLEDMAYGRVAAIFDARGLGVAK